MFLPVICWTLLFLSDDITERNHDILFHSLLGLHDVLLNKSPPLKSNMISVSHLSSSRVGECLRLCLRYSRELGSIFNIWNVTTWGLKVTCRKIRVAVGYCPAIKDLRAKTEYVDMLYIGPQYSSVHEFG